MNDKPDCYLGSKEIEARVIVSDVFEVYKKASSIDKDILLPHIKRLCNALYLDTSAVFLNLTAPLKQLDKAPNPVKVISEVGSKLRGYKRYE